MRKIYLLLLALLSMMFMSAVHAADIGVDAGIRFVSQNGDVLTAFPNTNKDDSTIYAEASVENNTSEPKNMILIVAVYDGSESLEKVLYNSFAAAANSVQNVRTAVTVPKGTQAENFVCRAYLWDGITGGRAYRTESTFLDLSTELFGIFVNGKAIDGYDDGVNEYKLQVNSTGGNIKVYPKSGGTSVIYKSVNIPGKSQIRLTSGNKKRDITIYTYIDHLENYSLSSLKYKIGSTIYDVEGFSPERTEYLVTLPQNTFYVTLLPEAYASIECNVRDTNDSPNIVNGVSFGKMRTDTTGPSYVCERPAINNIVPIKNEMTDVVITVSDGTDKTKYTVTFSCVQPRLTSFNLTGGDGDLYVPVFTSGAGFNNDNGTICASDRIWAASNISKKLIGASYFMSPYNNKSGQWWNGEERKAGDEYFNFTADTAGTVYMMCNANVLKYSDWTQVNNGITPTHPTGYNTGDKTWNSYTDTEYFAYGVKWNSDEARCKTCGVGELTTGEFIDGGTMYNHVFARHFEAGETVSVPHTGLFGNSAAEIIWAVCWDVDVNYPSGGTSGENGLVLGLDAMNNTNEGCLDEFADVWYDLSGGDGVELTDVCSWTKDGLKISTGSGSEAAAVLLGDAVDKTINSYNFTIELELGEIGAKAAVMTSKNEQFSLCAEKGKLGLYFAGIVRNPISVDVGEACSGVNHITVSKDTENNVYMKWYINGILKAEKKVQVQELKSVDKMMLASYNKKLYSGDTVIKRVKIYDYTMTVENIQGD